MNIETELLSIRAFSELLPIAEHSEVKVSFWGTEYICVADYEGTLHIDALASKTLELLKQQRYEFEETERAPGRQLAARIDKIYDEGSAKLNQSDCLTMCLGIIRKITHAVYIYLFKNNRCILTEWQGPFLEPNQDFEYYTRNQFINRFGVTPEDAPNRGYDFAGIRQFPIRWKVSPHCIALRRERGDL